MRAYVEFAKKAFQSNLTFRANYILSVFNTVISIFVYIAIWRVIYGTRSDFNGITLSMVTTNFVLGLAISNAFVLDDLMVAKKVISGTITSELLKPINFTLYVLFHNIGKIGFKLLMQFLPAFILSIIFIGIEPPHSAVSVLLFLVTVILGFLVLFCISFIISLISFWFYNWLNIWSVSTIKNTIISVLSGTLIPIWFMPQGLVNFIEMTPFDTIYFIPISIYLGRVGASEIWFSMAKQIIWIAILGIIGQLIWRAGVKKLVLHGG